MSDTKANIILDFNNLIASYDEANNNLPSIDAQQIEIDLRNSMRLYKASQHYKPAFELDKTAAQLFICQTEIYRKLHLNSLIDLCMFNTKHAINAFDKTPRSQQYLYEIFNALKAKRQHGATPNSRQQDCDFISLLLSVPNHAKLFNWQEIQDIFKNQGEADQQRALQIASINAKYKEQFIASLNQTPAINNSDYSSAAKLVIDDLNHLLSNIKDLKAFLKPLNNNFLANTVVNTWPKDNISWLIQKLIATNKDNNFNSVQILSALLKSLANNNSQLFLDELNKGEILEFIPAQFIIDIFNSNCSHELKSAILDRLISHINYLSKIPAMVVSTLCQYASLVQFKSLLAVDNIKIGLTKTPLENEPTAPVYSLLIHKEASHLREDIKERKAIFLRSNHYELLNSLSPLSILELVQQKSHQDYFNADKVAALLAKDECWSRSSAIELAAIDGKKLCGFKDENLFRAFAKYNPFKEAWLRKIINDQLWNQKGQGFFSKKTPATIIQARNFLSDKTDRPLISSEIKELIEMFRASKYNSHSYLGGLINLRDDNTQDFYNKAALLELPAIEVPEPNNI